MRRILAVTLVLALFAAPLALVANAQSIARYQKRLKMTAHEEHCAPIALGICGCYPGHAPAPTIVSPLPDTILTRPVGLPAPGGRMPEPRPPEGVISSGFLPITFHPPRS